MGKDFADGVTVITRSRNMREQYCGRGLSSQMPVETISADTLDCAGIYLKAP
jgi:hypothetical protein